MIGEEPQVRIWLDDDARTGPPHWQGTRADLGGVMPRPGDTLVFPRPGDIHGDQIAVIDEPLVFTFGGPNRTSDGPRFWLESIELGARGRDMTAVPSDPLDMARNAARFVGIVADMQGSDDPDVQIQARITGAGKQGMDSALVGGMMALVSLAADVRRIADHLTGGPS